jgi:hypothetical protein
MGVLCNALLALIFYFMETPRTNKNAGYYYGHGIKKNGDLVIDPNGPFVLADFARELERENTGLREVLQKLTNWGPDCLPDIASTEQVREFNRDREAALSLLANAPVSNAAGSTPRQPLT